ncbi:MAG: hypothetical protein M1120_02025 [Patescibacteria group bacterium]|nr:hypothetical protein [Patescibacteria group bacterium]
MLDFLVTYAPMMRWGQDASASVTPSPDQVNNWYNYGYGMTGRHFGLFGNMAGLGVGWMFWIWGLLCFITWILVNMVLVAIFRWLWKKGK